jgi:hypothetical protein
LTEQLYRVVAQLARLDYTIPIGHLPIDGVYVFFERGEILRLGEHQLQRIVRVGTHREDGRLRMRIRQHYGAVRSLNGNKNGSVFRKHLGGAVLRRANPADHRLREWLAQGGMSFPEVEEAVSRLLRENFTFACFSVPTWKERQLLERGLVALLAQFPLAEPSSSWLGHHAESPIIRCIGLWNTQHIDARPLTFDELRNLERLITASPSAE